MPNQNSITEPREKVERFLSELKAILSSPSFNSARDLDILLKKKIEDMFDPYTTANTLIALDFDNEDVRNELLKIGIGDYAETLIDSKDATLPPFYVFYRNVQSREVYIKVKIRDSIYRKGVLYFLPLCKISCTKPSALQCLSRKEELQYGTKLFIGT